MRRNNQKDDMYFEDGTIAIWRWLGFDRFFPPNQPKPSKVMKGCASVRRQFSSLLMLTLWDRITRKAVSILYSRHESRA
jgi:polycomb protein EED